MYDCIIVGAGPAGASAAYHLSKRGRRILLLDKASLPRYKPCGGGVSPQVAQWFDFDFDPVISQKVTQGRYTWKLGEVLETNLHTPMWMVRRDDFDHYLVQQAQKQGTTLKDNTKVTSIAFQKTSEASGRSSYWQVNAHCGAIFEGTYLIAADGGRGPMAKWLGFNQRKTTLTGAIEIEPKVTPKNPHVVHFDFGMVKNGYAWNFPKQDGYSIGSGVFSGKPTKGQGLVAPMVTYSSAFGVDGTQPKTFGHPVCLWNGNQTLHRPHALLAGEAACVVDPLTAEGIRPSMFTGVKAAEAIDAALGGDREALAHYTQVIQTELGSEMKLARRLAKVFYGGAHFSYKAILKHPSAIQALLKVFTGEQKYADVVNKAMHRLSGGLLT
ncbi:MAG: geranylgeranyl reductase family protein [Cyanobacteria bacterium P01_D01_bin.105]